MGGENKHLYALTLYARSQSAGRRREADMETRLAAWRRETVSDRHLLTKKFGPSSTVSPDQDFVMRNSFDVVHADT
jgi:hypothetical protein